MVENLPDNAGTTGDESSIPRSEDPLEEMAAHSNVLGVFLPGKSRRQLERVRHD